MLDNNKEFFPFGKYTRVILLAMGDISALTGVLFTIISFCNWFGADCPPENYLDLWPFLFVFIATASFVRTYHGSLLRPGMCLDRVEEIRRLFFSVFMTYLVMFSWIMFAHKNKEFSHPVLLFSLFFTFPVLPCIRFAMRFLMKKLHIGEIRILIAGAGKTGMEVAREISHSCYYGFKVIGFLDDDIRKRKQKMEGIPVLGSLKRAGKISKVMNVECIVCCLPPEAINITFREYSRIFRHMIFVADNSVLPITWLYPSTIGLYGSFEIRNKLLLKAPRFLKNTLEFFLAGSMSLLLIPLFLILALLVRLSGKGPIIYSAERLGQNGKPFKLYKFRTMRENAEKELEELLAKDPAAMREWSENFKLENDPRITPIGKFLRVTSLDELPQFWNVLKGDMAVIGPRPIVEKEVKYYGESYELRKRVKPGITGFWQISGRNDCDYQDRVQLDMYYIMNWSVWLDYYIFFKTIFIVLARRGAK